MKMRITLIAVMGTGIFLTGSRAAEWTQWRGPKRDGISTETNLLKSWFKGGPRQIWHAKDVGFGYGSVVEKGGRLFLLGNSGPDNEFVRALDARSGRIVWTTRIGNVGNPKQQPSYPGARSTPTLDGILLYALSSDGDLACLDVATGRIHWKKSLRVEFGGKPGVWAYAESPLVDGDRVIATPGGDSATMVALNKKTGAIIWKAALRAGDEAGYSSAVVSESGGIRQYVQFLSKGLVGIGARSGMLLWRFDKANDTRFGVHAATPVVSGDYVYAATAAGGGLARLKRNVEVVSAESVYVERKAPNGLGGAVKVGDYLFGTTSAALLCIEYATGKICWEDRSVGAASLCYADGRLYVHGENGDVALVEATPQAYRELGRFAPANAPDRGHSKAWAYPAVSNGRLYIRDLNSLWAYDIRATR